MPWNGSGAFTRIYSWVADAAASLDISASRMDTDSNDIATNGLGNCLTRDGQGIATANLPMGGFRHTGAGNGVNLGDYATVGQLSAYSVLSYGADPTGVADSTSAFQSALSAALTGIGYVTVPGGRFLINGQLNVGVRMVGAGSFANNAHTGPGTLLIQGTNAGTFISLNAGFGLASLEHLAISAWNASNTAGDAVQIGPNGGGILFDVGIKYGRYCINIQSPDAILFGVNATNAFSSICYNVSGAWFYRCNFDQGNSNIGISQSSVPVWSNGASITSIGQAVHLGSSPTGIMLRCTKTGVTGASLSAPSPWSYNTTIVDGTVNWVVDAPWNSSFASIYLDSTATGAAQNYIDGCDLSGSVWNSVYMNVGTTNIPQATYIKGSNLNPMFQCVNANGGSDLHISGCGVFPLAGSGSTVFSVALQTGWNGNFTIENCAIICNGSSQTCIIIAGGTNAKIIGCDFNGGGTAINIGGSVTGVQIIGNQLGGGTVGNTANANGVVIQNNAADIIITGNDIRAATTEAITIGTGCTNIDISHNLLGGTGAITNSSGSGAGIRIRDNPGYNPQGASALSPGASAWTYTASSSPETVYLSASTSITALTQGGTSILPAATGANVVLTVGLDPGESIVVTYTGTLTGKKMVH